MPASANSRKNVSKVSSYHNDSSSVRPVRTDFLGYVTPTARRNYRFMVKCSDHSTKFKVIYFILTKDKPLSTLVKFVQDSVMSL